MTTRIAQGDSKEDAASFAYKTLAFPMLTGTFVTAAGLRADRLRAERGRRIHLLDLRRRDHRADRVVVRRRAVRAAARRRPAQEAEDRRRAKPSVVLRVFRALLVGAMRVRWLTIAVTLGCFVAALLALPFVPRQFFPASDRPELVVDLTLPQNASIFASDTGRGQARRHAQGRSRRRAAGAPMSGAARSASICRSTSSSPTTSSPRPSSSPRTCAARERLHAKLEKELAEQLPSVVARVSPLELGPPVGWPVQYRVSGPDLAQVRAIALKLGQAMGGDPNLRRVNFDWMEPAREVRITIDQDQARLLGLSSQALAGVLNTVMTGTPITQVRDDIYLVNVIARATTSSASRCRPCAACNCRSRTAAPCR